MGDMAAGAIPDQDKILSLFNSEVSPVSPKFEYVTAAKVGKIVKNSGLCEVRYTCPLNTVEIASSSTKKYFSYIQQYFTIPFYCNKWLLCFSCKISLISTPFNFLTPVSNWT